MPGEVLFFVVRGRPHRTLFRAFTDQPKRDRLDLQSRDSVIRPWFGAVSYSGEKRPGRGWESNTVDIAMLTVGHSVRTVGTYLLAKDGLLDPKERPRKRKSHRHSDDVIYGVFKQKDSRKTACSRKRTRPIDEEVAWLGQGASGLDVLVD